MLRFTGLAAVLLVVAGFVSITGNVSALSSITFATTAQWNSGTRSSIDTTLQSGTSTCLAPPSNSISINKSLGFFGVGETVNSAYCPSGTPEVSSSGLVLSYDMATLSAGKMKDFSGVGNVGTITGTQVVAGKYGNARFFNGVAGADFIRTASNAGLNPAHLTVAFWENATSSAANHIALDKSDNSSVGGTSYSFLIQSGTGKVRFTLGTGWHGGATGVQLLTNGSIIGGWHHIVGTFDGTTVRLYVDGAYITSGTASFAMYASSSDLTIGERLSDSLNMLGSIDEVLLFNRPLSFAEIGKLYLDGRPAFASSGLWTSPVESGNAYPTLITLAYGNVSVARFVSLIQLQTPTGIVFWSRNVALTSGSAFAIIPSFPIQAVSGNWTVSLTLTGNGTGTPFVSSLVIGLQTVQSAGTLDANTWIFIFELIAYLAFMGLAVGLGVVRDNILWLVAGLIPAGMIMIGLSFQAWTVTSSFFASIAPAMVGVITITFAVVNLLRSFHQ